MIEPSWLALKIVNQLLFKNKGIFRILIVERIYIVFSKVVIA